MEKELTIDTKLFAEEICYKKLFKHAPALTKNQIKSNEYTRKHYKLVWYLVNRLMKEKNVGINQIKFIMFSDIKKDIANKCFITWVDFDKDTKENIINCTNFNMKQEYLTLLSNQKKTID